MAVLGRAPSVELSGSPALGRRLWVAGPGSPALGRRPRVASAQGLEGGRFIAFPGVSHPLGMLIGCSRDSRR